MSVFNVISLLGGLALFLYGMRIMGDGLKEGSSDTLKNAIEKVTNNPIKGFFVGLLVTALIQSSTATIVITSGLVGAGIVSLHQSVGIILGANVGTTVTGQIIRLLDISASPNSPLNFFKPQTLAPIAAIIGIICIMALTNKMKNASTVGTIAMGFGILFTGLLSMTAAVEPLQNSPEFAAFITNFSTTPILGWLTGLAVAFVLQSSSATIGILQALSITGAFTFKAIYPIIIGVYMGDCVTTAIVCSIGSKADAKRTGIIHILFNLCETVVVFAGVTILHKCGTLDRIWDTTMNSGLIANTHTVFNLSCAVLLLPMAGIYEKIANRIIKDDPQIGTNISRELDMLDDKLFVSPSLALAAAQNAITTMAKLAQEGTINAFTAFYEYDQRTVDVINENELSIDRLADAVDNYLVRLSPYIHGGNNAKILNNLMQSFGEFERIGDYAVNLTENAAELREKNETLSETAKEELRLTGSLIREILEKTYICFSKRDPDAAREIEPIEEVVDDFVAKLRSNHIKRLQEGKCRVYAGLEFLDSLVNIERIADQCSNLGIFGLQLVDDKVLTNHHDYIKELHQGNDPFFNMIYKTKHDLYMSALNDIQEEKEN